MHFIVSYVYENNGTVANTIKIKNIARWKTLHAAFFVSLLFSAYFPRKRSNKLFKNLLSLVTYVKSEIPMSYVENYP